MKSIRHAVVIASALAACAPEPSAPSGPPAPTIESFGVGVGSVTAAIRNTGGPGEVRLTVWGSTLGNFNGQPARSFPLCARPPVAMAAGERQVVDLACTNAAVQATVSVRDASAATGWRITACRAESGECNPDIRAGAPDAP